MVIITVKLLLKLICSCTCKWKRITFPFSLFLFSPVQKKEKAPASFKYEGFAQVLIPLWNLLIKALVKEAAFTRLPAPCQTGSCQRAELTRALPQNNQRLLLSGSCLRYLCWSEAFARSSRPREKARRRTLGCKQSKAGSWLALLNPHLMCLAPTQTSLRFANSLLPRTIRSGFSKPGCKVKPSNFSERQHDISRTIPWHLISPEPFSCRGKILPPSSPPQAAAGARDQGLALQVVGSHGPQLRSSGQSSLAFGKSIVPSTFSLYWEIGVLAPLFVCSSSGGGRRRNYP